VLADPAARRTLLRVALGTLAVSAAAVGVPALLTPRAFFDGFPFVASWVAALPPFNAHLVADVGGLHLAFALLFGWAAVTLARGLVVPLCVAWGGFAVVHLGFHLTHLDGFGPGDAVSQSVGLATVLALPALCVALRDAARPG
jgi:hypothetical protein